MKFGTKVAYLYPGVTLATFLSRKINASCRIEFETAGRSSLFPTVSHTWWVQPSSMFFILVYPLHCVSIYFFSKNWVYGGAQLVFNKYCWFYGVKQTRSVYLKSIYVKNTVPSTTVIYTLLYYSRK